MSPTGRNILLARISRREARCGKGAMRQETSTCLPGGAAPRIPESLLYKGDYPFLHIAAVSHNVTRRCKARLRSATRASFRSVRERTDPFAGGRFERN